MMNMTMDMLSKSEHGFVANAPSSVSVFSLARRVAEFNVPVLITGETGTGKECVAKYIHQKAMGNNSPYIAVNCAAIPESMLEAILFGYEKGLLPGPLRVLPVNLNKLMAGHYYWMRLVICLWLCK